MHSILIGLHAAFGGVAFVAGVVAISRARLLVVFVWSLVGTIAFMMAALVEEWGGLHDSERIVFSALALLAVYMLIRAGQAWRERLRLKSEKSWAYLDHIGFNLIALFDAFVVVLVLDLGGAVWLMVTIGVLVAAAGHFLLRAVQSRAAAHISYR
jgi:hypothetical protein